MYIATMYEYLISSSTPATPRTHANMHIVTHTYLYISCIVYNMYIVYNRSIYLYYLTNTFIHTRMRTYMHFMIIMHVCVCVCVNVSYQCLNIEIDLCQLTK